MTVTPATEHTSTETGTLGAIWLEITGQCQLSCVQCYAGSGPEGTHGTMAVTDWERVLEEAAVLGTRMVCVIGGEPVLNPDLPRIVRHALSLGMETEVYSNLVFVGDLWDLYQEPGVRLATSWYTSDRLEHQQITGRDTFRQTLGNIEEATRRGIPLRVGLITGILPGQHAAEGEELLRTRGVSDAGTDHLREFGRGTVADPSQACGSCGHGKAAVLPDGSVTPCPLTRWLTAGSVLDVPLADTLGTVTELASTLPARAACPSDRGECRPDVYCAPLCAPNPPCKPRI